jgi:TonB family protein
MVFSSKLKHEIAPIAFAVALHLMVFAALFSFSPISVDISNFTSAGSFTMTSISSQEDGVFEKKTITKPQPQTTTSSENNSQNSKPNNSDSSSEIVYDTQNLGNVQPQYPLASKRRGEEGTVLISATVDASGLPSKVKIFKSSSFSSLDNAAVEAIEKWHFVPAKKFGQNIESSIIIPINFKLTQGNES